MNEPSKNPSEIKPASLKELPQLNEVEAQKNTIKTLISNPVPGAKKLLSPINIETFTSYEELFNRLDFSLRGSTQPETTSKKNEPRCSTLPRRKR